MTGSVYDKVNEILIDKDVDDIIFKVVASYCRQPGKSIKVAEICLAAMNTNIRLKDEEIRDWHNCVEAMPKKVKLNSEDKNIWIVFSYCKAYLNFPKWCLDAIADPQNKTIPTIKYFESDKFTMEMWGAFKEVVISRYKENPNDTWFKTLTDSDRNYIEWCSENMELIEGNKQWKL